MKSAERLVLLAVPLLIAGGAYAIYYQVHENRAEIQAAVAAGEYERPILAKESTDIENREAWRTIYPSTVPMLIGNVSVQASIAGTLSSRMKGLSETPYLPDDVVKLFVFGAAGEHSIWMKDMNYALDILWVDGEGAIVHIEENVAPETFPESFASPTPAWYVVEASAGFVAANNVSLGDRVVIPQAAG